MAGHGGGRGEERRRVGALRLSLSLSRCRAPSPFSTPAVDEPRGRYGKHTSTNSCSSQLTQNIVHFKSRDRHAKSACKSYDSCQLVHQTYIPSYNINRGLCCRGFEPKVSPGAPSFSSLAQKNRSLRWLGFVNSYNPLLSCKRGLHVSHACVSLTRASP